MYDDYEGYYGDDDTDETWCEGCEEYHNDRGFCGPDGFHEEYCDCSVCSPPQRRTENVTPAGGVL